MGSVRQSDRGRATANFLHRDAMGEITHAAAAVFFLDGNAVEAERTHSWPQLDRETISAIDLGGEWRNLRIGKIAHRRAQQVDLGAEIVIESGIAGVLHGAYMARPCRRAKGILPPI